MNVNQLNALIEYIDIRIQEYQSADAKDYIKEQHSNERVAAFKRVLKQFEITEEEWKNK